MVFNNFINDTDDIPGFPGYTELCKDYGVKKIYSISPKIMISIPPITDGTLKYIADITDSKP
jgi:hypothetical protein